MKIAIVTPVLVEGDAVGNDAMGMYGTLKKAGHQPILYAEASQVPLPVQSLTTLSGVDMLIYHHSIGTLVCVNQFVSFGGRKVMKYHNITPPHFFEGVNPHAQRMCQMGYDQLEVILSQQADFWADSEYNGLGLQKVRTVPFRVIPPFNQSNLLMLSQPDPHPVLPFNDWNINILMVGRVAPNKDNIVAVEAFAKYHQKNRNCRLIIVGDCAGEYGEKVRQRITTLGLPNVVITGKVTLEVLKAFYNVADLLLITSKHEGFCVPMIEAMALSVPVLANQECALPYTGGDAVHYVNNPDDIAAGIEYVLTNKSSFIERGRNRYRERYQLSSIESGLLSAVNSTHA